MCGLGTEIDISVSKLLGFETFAKFLRVSVSKNLVSEKKSRFRKNLVSEKNLCFGKFGIVKKSLGIGFGKHFGIVIQWLFRVEKSKICTNLQLAAFYHFGASLKAMFAQSVTFERRQIED